jgi:hypothetical protein
MDFVLDERFGPLLNLGSEASGEVEQPGSGGIRNDADGTQNQETSQVERPARMVGQTELDSAENDRKSLRSIQAAHFSGDAR